MKKMNLLAFAAVLLLSACDQSATPASAADAQATPAASSAPAPAVTPPSAAAPAPKPAKPKPKPQIAAKKICADCGVISAIREVKIEGAGTGMGAVAGAAAGGAVGNQFGKGQGKTALTVVGVLAGATAGHMAEKEIRSETVKRLTLSMEDGSVRTVDLKELNGLGVGAKVKVSGNTVYPREH